MESLYQSSLYSSAGAPSPYLAGAAPTFADQHHQLPPPAQYRHHHTMFAARSPYPSSSYHHHQHQHQHPSYANGHGADLPTSAADPYATSWSPSYMSPPALPPPQAGNFRRYGPAPLNAATSCYPGAPCSPTDSGSMTAPIQRPKLTTTVWEDESTVCYQVDAKNICVARRQDNDMVNGTKLLNVVGMSRGKRDGILKNEKGRVVVKVGAMHLKGVWITFSRAKDLATKFKILDLLYPLFTDDPSMFLSINGMTNSDSNGSSAPVTSDTASVETAQTSSTVKSLGHSSSNLPPPMPYKADSYSMLPQWMDSRPYQQSLPSISNTDSVFRSQNCSPVPSAVAPACSSEDSYAMFSQPEYDYRSIGRTLAGQHVFSSHAYDGNTFLSHKTDIFGEQTACRYPNSPPSDKSYSLDELPIPQQPSSVYESRQHDLESVGSHDNSSDLAAAVSEVNVRNTTSRKRKGATAAAADDDEYKGKTTDYIRQAKRGKSN